MTTAATTGGISASDLLFGQETNVEAVRAALSQHGVLDSLVGELARLSPAGKSALSGQVAQAVKGLLNLDLGDVLVSGWQKYDDLTAAARRTIDSPGSSEVVDLAGHTVSSTHNPRLDLIVDGTTVATLDFALSLTFAIKGVVGTVRDGHLVELHTGLCDVSGELSAEGREVASRSQHVELPWLVPLGNGIPLLVDDDPGPQGVART